MDLKSQIKAIAEEYLKDASFFLVEVTVKGVAGKTKILVLLDGDHGVTIDDCAELSRQVSIRVEAEGLIDYAFVLEVSSPGLDQPLQLKRQYLKNVGRDLKIGLKDGQLLMGKLLEVGESAITIDKVVKENKKKTYQPEVIGFDEIDKANVLVSFK